MKTNFKFNQEKAIKLCKEYSEDFETLKKLIERIDIYIRYIGIIQSPWDKGMKAVKYEVTVCGFTFPFYGSHNDAEILSMTGQDVFKNTKKRSEIRNSVLYSVLCCIGSDYALTDSEPEDLGMDSDSIKDMAKWNEIKEHSRKLNQALKLTQDELESLPS